MADKDSPEASLELPSLGFGRKKKRERRAAEDAEDTIAPPAPVEPEPAAPEPAPEPQPEPAPEPASAPAIEAEPEPDPTPEPDPAPEPEPAPPPPPPAVVTPSAPIRPRPVAPKPAAEPVAGAPVPDVEPEPAASRGPGPSLPSLAAMPAALVTGLVAGLVLVGLVWASQAACDLVRGTSSCGDAGFLLLLASLIVTGWLGGVLMRGFGVPDGASTSFLGIGLVAVVLMLFLGGQLFAWWVVVVVPLVAVAAYALSQRVTTAMVEPAGREMHR